MLKLWHCRDARSFRVLWALEELGLSYELVNLPFPPRFEKPEYLEENPLGTIPLLVDGETRMTESSAIPHYLAVRHGDGRFAVDVSSPDYGAYLNWLHHGEATLTFPQAIFLRYKIFEKPEKRQPQVAADYRRWFLVRLKLLEQTLSDGREFLVDDKFTMADISVGYAIMLATRLRMKEDMPDVINDWFANLASRQGYLSAKARQDD